MSTANYLRSLISRPSRGRGLPTATTVLFLSVAVIAHNCQQSIADGDAIFDERFDYDFDGAAGVEFAVESTTQAEAAPTLVFEEIITTAIDGEDFEEVTTDAAATTEEAVTAAPEKISGNDLLYCREDLCLQYDFTGQLVAKKHVACGHDGAFAEDCPTGRTLFKIDPQMEAFIVHLHNEARNRLANGSVEGFESALRMPTVEWNDELAQLAELNVKSCKFQHDECRNTDLYRQAGQNLALGYYPVGEDLFDILEKLTNLWFNEYRDANQAVMDEFENPPNVTIGHFTQMVSDRTTAIGCGIVIYPQKVAGFTFKVVLFACNYSITSIYGQPVYRKGPAASECSHGTNPYYEGLCREEENQLIKSVPFYDEF